VLWKVKVLRTVDPRYTAAVGRQQQPRCKWRHLWGHDQPAVWRGAVYSCLLHNEARYNDRLLCVHRFGDSKHLSNVGQFLWDWTAQHYRRQAIFNYYM